MINELLLETGGEIPFPEGQLTIHNPKIREIALIGEEAFLSGCQFINFNKNKFLNDKDNFDLKDKSNFDIFMSIINDGEKASFKDNARLVFTLLFPGYTIKFTPTDIIVIGAEGPSRINNTNFENFKDIFQQMFVLKDISFEMGDYNPIDKRSAKIAEKFRKAKEKKNGSKEKTSKVSIFSRYLSILAVGEQKDLNVLKEYTVYQLQDEFTRFHMREDYNTYLSAKMAGVKDIDDVKHWMIDIHSQPNVNN